MKSKFWIARSGAREPSSLGSRTKRRVTAGVLLLLSGCAGMERSCATCNAENYGADWLVVQYQYNGTPVNCWQIKNTSIANEPGSDGIYWKDPSGHLVHISGWYNRVQVEGGRFEEAAKTVGVELVRCTGGAYRS